jgi:hypothetical protein
VCTVGSVSPLYAAAMVCDCIKFTQVALAFSGSHRLKPNANKVAVNILVNFLIVLSASRFNKTIITFYLKKKREPVS